MVMKEEENVIHSCDGVVLAAEGSIHICAGKLILTETTLVVEEDFFDLVARTSIPIETIKSIRKRSSLKNAAKITLYKQTKGTESTLWEKRRRNFIFRDNRMCKMFVSAVKGLRVFEDEDAEEGEEVGERGIVKVDRHLKTTMVAKSMTLDHHLLLENSAEFLRFVDGEVIVPAGGICEGVYWVDFGSVNVTGEGEGEKESILTQIPVGGCFGELQFVLGSSLGDNALIAEDEVVLKFWSKTTLNTLMEKNISFGAGFMGTISNNIRSRLISITALASGADNHQQEDHPISVNKGADTSISTTNETKWQKSYKCKMRKISGGGGGVGVGVGGGVVGSPSFPQPASLSSLPSTVSSPVRGTLVVDGRGVVFSYRVFGFKSKMRATFREVNAGDVTLKLVDFRGKPAVEVHKGPEKTLFMGEKIKEAFQKMIETRENLTSTILSDDGSFSEEMGRPSDLRPEDWGRILGTSCQKKYAEGAVVVKEGETSHSIFQITRGSVKVKKQGRHVATLQEGAIFGEMSFLSWFTEGKDALVSADVVAAAKVEMVCLDGKLLSALLFQDDGLCLRFFRYSVQLMSKRIENTIPMEGDWMKIWCPAVEIKSLKPQKDIYTWLKKDLKLPNDVASLYRKRLKDADFTTIQSLSLATNSELEKAGIAPIHRRKILWWVSHSEVFGEKGEGGVYLVTWMRKEMLWPEDVIEKYTGAFGDNITTVSDLKKLGHQDLVDMKIAPIHRRKIAFWMTTHH